VVSVFLVAAALTIVPALGFLWYLLGRYEGYFEDARVFFSLVVGFFAGLVVAFLEGALFQFDSESFVLATGIATAFALFVAGYAFVEAAAKTIVLGTEKFRKRKDTPYYGAALGIGFGAMVALQSVALGFTRIGQLGWRWDAVTVALAAFVLMMAFGTLLVNGAVGVWIGRGSAEGRLWQGTFRGALLHMPLLVLLWVSRWVPGLLSVSLAAVGAMVYGGGLVYYTQRNILDKVVPPEIRDLVMKERRRAEREKMRGPDRP
jgi:hypothetical protein